MSSTTLCPTCNTRFRISEAQLDAYDGLVRCGRCQALFDARKTLQDDKPGPQPDSLASSDGQLQEGDGVPEAGQHEDSDYSDNAISTAEPIIQAQENRIAVVPVDGAELAPPKKPLWPLIAVNAVLAFLLLGQCAYIFRVQLASSMPGLKPALVASCKFFLCTVPLPRKLDLMSIESSDLVAEPAQPSIITLNAILRSQARYAQAFPNLELTLTDDNNRPVARRTFSPLEYLGPGNDEQQGLLPNRDLNIKLNIDTSDLKPSGYKLFIY